MRGGEGGTFTIEEWKEQAGFPVMELCLHSIPLVGCGLKCLVVTATERKGSNESLILAQDKRWRRALRMQVERTFG